MGYPTTVKKVWVSSYCCNSAQNTQEKWLYRPKRRPQIFFFFVLRPTNQPRIFKIFEGAEFGLGVQIGVTEAAGITNAPPGGQQVRYASIYIFYI